MRAACYRPTHFRIEELVTPGIFQMYGVRAFSLFDSRLLWTADAVRGYFDKPVRCNNWHNDGTFTQRGYRPPDSLIGAETSEHRFGRALDIDVIGLGAEEVRQEILSRQERDAFQYITRLEVGVNWVHFDLKNTLEDHIITFKP